MMHTTPGSAVLLFDSVRDGSASSSLNLEKGRTERASESSDSPIFCTEMLFSCPVIFENGHSLSGLAKSVERASYNDKRALIKVWPFVAATAFLACPRIKVTGCCFNKMFLFISIQ